MSAERGVLATSAKTATKARNDFRVQFAYARVAINSARQARRLGAYQLVAEFIAKASTHRHAAFEQMVH